MPKLTFDTNIFITHKRIKLPESFYISVVVLQELFAGADDDATVKKLLNIKKFFEKVDRLLVPNADPANLCDVSAIKGLEKAR